MFILINNMGKQDVEFSANTIPYIGKHIRLIYFDLDNDPPLQPGDYSISSCSNDIKGLSGVFHFEVTLQKIPENQKIPPPIYYFRRYPHM